MLESQIIPRAADLGAVPIGDAINSIVGVAATQLVGGPASRGNILVLVSDKGAFRFRLGDQADRSFVPGDVTVGADTIDITAHGWVTGDGPVQIENDLSDPPAGLDEVTDYFVIRTDDDTIQLALSLVDALAGTQVDITDVGTGVNTIGGMANTLVMPAADIVDGSSSFRLAPEGFLVLPGPIKLTAKGDAADAVLSYWYA